MELQRGDIDLELLNVKLNDPVLLQEYKSQLDNYQPTFIPRLLGGFLIICGNLVYGKKPSYLKFRSIEIIARVPYHSWSSAGYTLLTLFYTNEQKALHLAKVEKYSRMAQDNETMHVIVVTQICKAENLRVGFIRRTFIPMAFAFFYFWASYFLYLIKPKYSYELNFIFENHAFQQYNKFIEIYGEELKVKPVYCNFLNWYGRNPRNQYELFRSIRNDEIIHRNSSIHELLS